MSTAAENELNYDIKSDEKILLEGLEKMTGIFTKLGEATENKKEKDGLARLVGKITSFKTRIKNEQSEQACEIIPKEPKPEQAPTNSFFQSKQCIKCSKDSDVKCLQCETWFCYHDFNSHNEIHLNKEAVRP